MTQVTVTINGRQFRMACEDGEEAHLTRLAADLDQRIARLRARFGEIGDTRLTVMAALTLGDELAETSERMKQARGGACRRCRRRACIGRARKATQAAVSAALNSAAERIENDHAASSTRRSATAAWRSGDLPRPCSAVGRASGAAARSTHYIGRAGLRGAYGVILPGPYDPEGSCP